MLKNASTPHLISLILILAASIVTLVIVDKSMDGDFEGQQASVVTASTPNPQGYITYVMGTGGGFCVHITRDSNGNAVASATYRGRFNGSGDCVRAFPTQDTRKVIALQAQGQTAVAFDAPEAYYASDVGIAILQAKLQTLGFLDQVEVTGTFSQKTFDAIRALQTKNRISPTGYLDPATLIIINATATKDFTPATQAPSSAAGTTPNNPAMPSPTAQPNPAILSPSTPPRSATTSGTTPRTIAPAPSSTR